jgi:inhibitor of KinA
VTPDHPTFRPVADHALLVEFGEVIADDIHAAVLRLDRALAETPVPGVSEAVPAYASLLVEFDPVETDHAQVRTALTGLLAAAIDVAATPTLREVEVCYDGSLAPDMAEVARQTGLSTDAVIAAHLAGDYRVYMYGFAPGYAYMAGVPPALRLDRKAAPVRGVAAGTVLIAGPQGLISTVTMPTGWWRIGASPTRILLDDPARPFLFDVGDRVRFRRIGLDAFHAAKGVTGHG